MLARQMVLLLATVPVSSLPLVLQVPATKNSMLLLEALQATMHAWVDSDFKR